MKITAIPTNEVQRGDCLDLLAKLPDQSVDLIYLDPPFGTQKQQTQTNRKGTKTITYEDKWGSTAEYIAWLSARLVQCRRVLKNTGALMLHCDWRMSHRIRVLLDDLMGENNFRNEIIWSYRRWTNVQNSLQRLHQTIFYYGRSDQHMMNSILVDYSPTTNLDQIWQARSRDDRGKSVYATDEEGRHVPYSKAKNGVPLGDVWEIPYLNPKARERTGYPTQKPIELLLRVLDVASKPGDLVLDPFCGSGTTPVAAMLSGRSYLGFDVSDEAIKLTLDRLSNPIVSESVVTKEGRDGFLNKSSNLDVRRVLSALDARVVERNKNLDGILSNVPAGLQIGVRILLDAEDQDAAEHAFTATLIKKRFSGGLLIRGETSQISLFAEKTTKNGPVPIFVADCTEALESPERLRCSLLDLLKQEAL
jgi:site-specific DNA-methyltransferase (adenine-specific)